MEAFKVQIGAALTLSKSLWVQGDAPDEVQNALITAAADVATDPEFLKQAESELGGYQPTCGAELDAAIQENLVDVDPQAIEWLRPAMLGGDLRYHRGGNAPVVGADRPHVPRLG